MPFSLRTSVTAGPFRFSLSKSGLGFSVGIRGLRIGTGLAATIPAIKERSLGWTTRPMVP